MISPLSLPLSAPMAPYSTTLSCRYSAYQTYRRSPCHSKYKNAQLWVIFGTTHLFFQKQISHSPSVFNSDFLDNEVLLSLLSRSALSPNSLQLRITVLTILPDACCSYDELEYRCPARTLIHHAQAREAGNEPSDVTSMSTPPTRGLLSLPLMLERNCISGKWYSHSDIDKNSSSR